MRSCYSVQCSLFILLNYCSFSTKSLDISMHLSHLGTSLKFLQYQKSGSFIHCLSTCAFIGIGLFPSVASATHINNSPAGQGEVYLANHPKVLEQLSSHVYLFSHFQTVHHFSTCVALVMTSLYTSVNQLWIDQGKIFPAIEIESLCSLQDQVYQCVCQCTSTYLMNSI